MIASGAHQGGRAQCEVPESAGCVLVLEPCVSTVGFCRCYPTYSYIHACPRTCVPECMQMSAHTEVPTICILSFLCFDFYFLRLPQIPYGVMAVFRLFVFILISFPPPLTFPRFIPLGLSPFHFVFYFCCFLPGCLKRLPPDFEQEFGGSLWRCRCSAMAVLGAFFFFFFYRDQMHTVFHCSFFGIVLHRQNVNQLQQQN